MTQNGFLENNLVNDNFANFLVEFGIVSVEKTVLHITMNNTKSLGAQVKLKTPKIDWLNILNV